VKVKINEGIMKEGLRIGNRSMLRVYELNQERYTRAAKSEPKYSPFNQGSGDSNPYDVNLLDKKGTLTQINPSRNHSVLLD
jgi:hypothetical protein